LQLTDRQERILQALVEDYVSTGRAVGSGSILDHSGLPVSSATVRNELALLEEAGLVLQLHTSGGRIPTTQGYRYYIEHLLPTPMMSDDDQVTIRHQFHQAYTEVEEWMKLAAAVLALALGAFTVLDIQISHFYQVDSLLLPLALGVLPAAVVIAQSNDQRAYIWGGVALGAVFASTNTALLLVVPLGLERARAARLQRGSRRRRGGPAPRRAPRRRWANQTRALGRRAAGRPGYG